MGHGRTTRTTKKKITHEQVIQKKVNEMDQVWNTSTPQEHLAIVEEIKKLTNGKVDFTEFIGKRV